jgi:ABC-2 type transport system permease protein
MRKILTIIWKDTLLRFSSRSELLFFLILPVIFTFILAGGTSSQGADNRIHLLVVDQADSSLSQQVIAELERSPSVRPDVMDLEEAETAFEAREASVLLIIPSNSDIQTLEERQVNLELKQLPNSLNALAAQRAVQAVLFRLGSTISIATQVIQVNNQVLPFSSDMERQVAFEAARQEAQALLESAPQRLKSVLGGTSDPVEYDPSANSSAGQMITWVFIPLIGISGSMTYERLRGTLRRLMTTPTEKSIFLLATILGHVLWALVQMTLLVVFGVLVMKVNWAQDPAALVVMMLASILAAAALGTMLGTMVKTEGQASGLSIMLGMVMALLGGCWYPLELFPAVVQNLVKVLPTTWSMQGMLDILLRGQGVMGILPEAGVLLGFTLLFLLVGILRFRYE